MALAIVAWAAMLRLEPQHRGRAATALVVLSPLAIGAINSAMTQGQSSLIVNAALAMVLVTLARQSSPARQTRGGLAFALAMTKPSSALLFVVPVIARRRWLTLIICAGTLSAAALATGWWLRQSIAFQFRQFFVLSRQVVGEGANPILNALVSATSAASAAQTFAIAGMVATLAIAWLLQRADLFVVFAALAVVSRLFTYHRSYDDVLLAFLMIELAGRAWSDESTRGWKVAWILGGLSVWLPYSWYVSAPAQLFQIAAWCTLVAALIVDEWCERGDSNPHSLSATGS